MTDPVSYRRLYEKYHRKHQQIGGFWFSKQKNGKLNKNIADLSSLIDKEKDEIRKQGEGKLKEATEKHNNEVKSLKKTIKKLTNEIDGFKKEKSDQEKMRKKNKQLSDELSKLKKRFNVFLSSQKKSMLEQKQHYDEIVKSLN